MIDTYQFRGSKQVMGRWRLGYDLVPVHVMLAIPGERLELLCAPLIVPETAILIRLRVDTGPIIKALHFLHRSMQPKLCKGNDSVTQRFIPSPILKT